MLPFLNIGPLHVATYGLVVAAAIALGGVLGVRQAQRAGVSWTVGFNAALYGGVAGFIGARLFALLVDDRGQPVWNWHALTSGGLTWYGGAIGGILVGGWVIKRAGIPLSAGADQGAPALVAGHALGRMACLVGGDDYGWASRLPWAIAFPKGHPPSTAGYLRSMGDQIAASVSNATVMRVQPTMVYEAIGNAIIAVWLWRRSHGRYRPWSNISLYLLSYGVLRFVLEFMRPKDDRLANGLTITQYISVAFVILGLIGLYVNRKREATTVHEQLSAAGGIPEAVRVTD